MLNINGFGCVSALGNNPEAFLRGLRQGISPCVDTEFSRLDGSVLTTPAFIGAKPDAAGLIEPRKLRRMFRLVRMVAVSARQALLMAGIDPSNLDPSRIGVVIGTAFGAL
ncbi:MAG: beta-ketoacyl synthase N-terminal-like domain-containing protein, partial [Planctomycetota bacterium]